MKNFLVVLCAGMLLPLAAMAQNASNQASMPDQNSANTTVQGCLSGSQGTYVVTQDGTGTAYTLAARGAEARKLGTLIHHEVKVTGEQQTANGNSASTGQSSAGAMSNGHSMASDFKVSSIEDMANECTGNNPPPPSMKPGNSPVPR